jgi:ribosomal protein L7Ae-like RNA K-turn-binding protein
MLILSSQHFPYTTKYGYNLATKEIRREIARRLQISADINLITSYVKSDHLKQYSNYIL